MEKINLTEFSQETKQDKFNTDMIVLKFPFNVEAVFRKLPPWCFKVFCAVVIWPFVIIPHLIWRKINK